MNSSRMADRPLAAEALKQLRKQGLDIKLGAKVSCASVAEQRSGGEVHRRRGRAVRQRSTGWCVAVGRRPYTKDLLGEGTGVEIDARGFIVVDEHCRTGAAECLRRRRLRARPDAGAQGEGRGRDGGRAGRGRCTATPNYDVVPSVIYTAPEIAWVGQSEAQAQRRGPQREDRPVSRSSPAAVPARWKPTSGFTKHRGRCRQRPRCWACTSSAPWPAS